MDTSNTFSLAGKGLKLDTKAHLTPHIGPLLTSTSITHIDFSGNTLGVEACAALAPLLTSQVSLRSADFHDIFTGRLIAEIPDALNHLLTALLSCKALTYIDLSDNAFGLRTVDPLLTFLSQHTPLQHLILNNNGMGPIAGTSIADALTTLASKKSSARASLSPSDAISIPHLTHLVCGRNRLESGSMHAWASCFAAHAPGLLSVKMTQNGIRPEGIAHLLTAGLSRCAQLQVLDMQDNTFALAGASALASALPGWPSLLELGVGDDLLGARGAVKVFDALSQGKNAKVEVLRLQYNDITARGVEALLQVARAGLPKLRRVELNGNKFDEDDQNIEALAELLSERKEEHGKENDPEEHWGLDELDELEEEDSGDDEEGEAEEAEDKDEDAREKILKEADEEEDEKVAQKEDKDVDDLAEGLGKTSI